MSLRQALTNAVARCTPLEMQHATSEGKHATLDATAMQLEQPFPSNDVDFIATSSATGVQLGLQQRATNGEKLHVAFASTCNTQPSALTAHRVTADLLRLADRVSDFYRDGPKARQEMREQCQELPLDMQADLLDHFKQWYCRLNTGSAA